MVEADEAIRPDTTLEVLAKLKAVGGDDATHTAGNAPGVNDGAGAIVVASDEWAKENGKQPLATVISYGQVADDFPYLAKTPANAAKQALEKIGRSPEDVDLWEINEAFASVAINSIRMLGVDEDKVNVNGGAIALGHPIGASGARIIGALVHELPAAAAGSEWRPSARAAARATRSCSRSMGPNVPMNPGRARGHKARGRLLRPRQDADGGVVGDGVRARRGQPRAGLAPAAR